MLSTTGRFHAKLINACLLILDSFQFVPSRMKTLGLFTWVSHSCKSVLPCQSLFAGPEYLCALWSMAVTIQKKVLCTTGLNYVHLTFSELR